MKWLEIITISHDQANKMMRISKSINSESTRNIGIGAYKIMRIASDIQDVGTYQHLGTKALYLIATLQKE